VEPSCSMQKEGGTERQAEKHDKATSRFFAILRMRLNCITRSY
jgi:hypothetical protein